VSNLQVVYQYFTLDQWKAIVAGVQLNPDLTVDEKFELLSKCPSAAL
jgi:hypothetical protein